MYDILNKKRKGEILTKEEIKYFVRGYAKGEIPDYQASALLMAICINGMTMEETSDLTMSMASFPKVLDFSGAFKTPVIDKHSTGGIGDKVTLIVLPIVVALGVITFKMSGRGLGHTGGTIDKLDSIEGFKTNILLEDALRLLANSGLCLISQTDDIAVADKKIYALRDVSGTIDSPALIASSVMSKKIAIGAQKIVLEVTYGTGAIIKTLEDAKALAKIMVEIGKQVGRETVAIITNMDEPLGNSVGNSLEIMEVVEFLNSSAEDLQRENIKDLVTVVFKVASYMLKLSGIEMDDKKNEIKILEAITSGAAYKKFIQLVKGQGGHITEAYLEGVNKTIDIPVISDKAKYTKEIYPKDSGYVHYVDAEKIGLALISLGGGRKIKEDIIDYSVGFILHKKTGEKVGVDESILTIYFNDGSNIDECIENINKAINIEYTKPEKKPIIDSVIK